MSEWWLSRGDGKTEGPLSSQALVQGLVAGQIPKRAFVCRVGEQAWVRISQIDEIWEAAHPEQIRTNVTEQPWFLSSADSGHHRLGASEADDERTQVLTPLPVITPTTDKHPFVTPKPQPAHQRIQQPSQGTVPTLGTPLPAQLPRVEGNYEAPIRAKVPTLDGISDAVPNRELTAITEASVPAAPVFDKPIVGSPRTALPATSHPKVNAPTNGAANESRAMDAESKAPRVSGDVATLARPNTPGETRTSAIPKYGSGPLGSLPLPALPVAPSTARAAPPLGIGALPGILPTPSVPAPLPELPPPTLSPPLLEPPIGPAKSKGLPNVPTIGRERLPTANQLPTPVSRQPTTTKPRLPAPPVPTSDPNLVRGSGLSALPMAAKPQPLNLSSVPVGAGNESKDDPPGIKARASQDKPQPASSDETAQVQRNNFLISAASDTEVESADEDNELTRLTSRATANTTALHATASVAPEDEQTTIARTGLRSHTPVVSPSPHHPGPLNAAPLHPLEATGEDDPTTILSPETSPHANPARSCNNADDEPTLLLRPDSRGTSRRSTEAANHARPRGPGPNVAKAMNAISALHGGSSPEDLVSDPSELLEECDDESPAHQHIPIATRPNLGIAEARTPTPNPPAKIAISPPSTPPVARRPRLPSSPSIVLQPEPMVHQEATQPAVRALRRGGSTQFSHGGLLLVILSLLLGALAVFLLARG